MLRRLKEGASRLPGGVWALGFTSLLMDTSSELVHSLLPVFLATVLGASMTTIGVFEGVAEATAAITKVFSGVLSDYLGRRKFLVVLGYGLGAATKPIFPLAASVSWAFGARFIDRIGKGIRGAPRDALIADLNARRSARRGLRAAPVSRHRGSGPRATARGGLDGAPVGRHSGGLLGGNPAGGAVGGTAHRRRA